MSLLTRVLVAGVVSALSASAFAGDRLADAAFARLDANNDGKLDAAELRQARINRFQHLDINGDGLVTAAEQAEASKRLFRRAEALESAMTTRFETLDVDGDGKLTQDEFVDMQRGSLAARFDKDGDGLISRAEFQAGMEAARAMR